MQIELVPFELSSKVNDTHTIQAHRTDAVRQPFYFGCTLCRAFQFWAFWPNFLAYNTPP